MQGAIMILYDPPSGWRYGFPRAYEPLPGEKLKDTLIRDGYPEKDVEFGAKYCRFLGTTEEIYQLMSDDERVRRGNA